MICVDNLLYFFVLNLLIRYIALYIDIFLNLISKFRLKDNRYPSNCFFQANDSHQVDSVQSPRVRECAPKCRRKQGRGAKATAERQQARRRHKQRQSKAPAEAERSRGEGPRTSQNMRLSTNCPFRGAARSLKLVLKAPY